MAHKHSLLDLKNEFILTEAARYLSGVFGEAVSDADILQLALDGHIKLSVDLNSPVWGAAGTIVDAAHAQRHDFPLDMITNKPKRFLVSLKINDNQYFNFADEVTSLRGIWDLPMIGSERSAVENELRKLSGIEANYVPNNELGAFVEGEDGEVYQLQVLYDDVEITAISCKRLNYRTRTGDVESSTFCSTGLPQNWRVVIRKTALMAFLQKHKLGESPAVNDLDINIHHKPSLAERIGKYNIISSLLINDFIKGNGYPPNSVIEVINRLKHKPLAGYTIKLEKNQISIGGSKLESINGLKRGIERALNQLKKTS